MRKLLCISLLLACAAWANAYTYSKTMAATVKGEYAGKADTLAKTLTTQFMNVSKGTFWSTPKDVDRATTYIYWQQAHAIDVYVYAYERLKDTNKAMASTYKSYIERWYQNHGNNYSSGATGFENPYTDDMLWICLTLLHMTEATGITKYATTAKTVYNNTIMPRLAEDERGQWLPWNSNGDGPNACTEGPACLLSAKLYEKYGDQKYLDNAVLFYNFMIKHQCKSDGRCEEPPLTYTQGVFGEACRVLYRITKKAEYKTKAKLFINYAFTSGRCTNGANILRHEGTTMDQSIFKAVLIPYAVNYVLDDDMELITRRNLSQYIQKNANTLWRNLDLTKYATSQIYCNYAWTEPWDYTQTASMGAMVSGVSLMENCARMCITLTTDPTGIDNVPESIKRPVEDDYYYSVGGQRVGSAKDGFKPTKGIYIKNGKKILVQ